MHPVLLDLPVVAASSPIQHVLLASTVTTVERRSHAMQATCVLKAVATRFLVRLASISLLPPRISVSTVQPANTVKI